MTPFQGEVIYGLTSFAALDPTTFLTTAHCCMCFQHMIAVALSALMNCHQALATLAPDPWDSPSNRCFPSLLCKCVTITLWTSPCGELVHLQYLLLFFQVPSSPRCDCHSSIFWALHSCRTTVLSASFSHSCCAHYPSTGKLCSRFFFLEGAHWLMQLQFLASVKLFLSS